MNTTNGPRGTPISTQHGKACFEQLGILVLAFTRKAEVVAENLLQQWRYLHECRQSARIQIIEIRLVRCC